MQTFSLDWMQEAEKLLQQLPGIFAVRFLAGNDHSTLEAIHILADTARNAKQVVRDVQAALSAAYALDIDHRIVSVAQLPVNPVKKEGLSESVPFAESRVKFNGLAYQDMPNRCSVQVTLQYQQTDYQGCAEGKPGRKWQDLLAAQAIECRWQAAGGDGCVYPAPCAAHADRHDSFGDCACANHGGGCAACRCSSFGRCRTAWHCARNIGRH